MPDIFDVAGHSAVVGLQTNISVGLTALDSDPKNGKVLKMLGLATQPTSISSGWQNVFQTTFQTQGRLKPSLLAFRIQIERAVGNNRQILAVEIHIGFFRIQVFKQLGVNRFGDKLHRRAVGERARIGVVCAVETVVFDGRQVAQPGRLAKPARRCSASALEMPSP